MSERHPPLHDVDDCGWVGTCECLCTLHTSERGDFLAATWWMALFAATLLLSCMNLLLFD